MGGWGGFGTTRRTGGGEFGANDAHEGGVCASEAHEGGLALTRRTVGDLALTRCRYLTGCPFPGGNRLETLRVSGCLQ